MSKLCKISRPFSEFPCPLRHTASVHHIHKGSSSHGGVVEGDFGWHDRYGNERVGTQYVCDVIQVCIIDIPVCSVNDNCFLQYTLYMKNYHEKNNIITYNK